MTKQITIYDLLPLLKKGWVAYDDSGWAWFSERPVFVSDEDEDRWYIGVDGGHACNLSAEGCPFNIKPFDKAWRDSLINVEHKEEE